MDYRVPAEQVEAELREKGSRFLAIVTPVADQKAAKECLEAIRAHHAQATHHCWAWRIGWPSRERSSDAGEPAGTAGLPILHVLRGAELTDVLAVVVRWFGGTKLGRGGLARAYSGAIREALEGLAVVVRQPTVELAVSAPYERLGAVKRLVHPPAVELVSEEYGEESRLVLRVLRERQATLEETAGRSRPGAGDRIMILKPLVASG